MAGHRSALRKALLDPKIAEHHGRVVKNTGDGVLVGLPAWSTRCDAPARFSAAWPNKISMCRRSSGSNYASAFHVGDIIFDDNDIFGDGVNIAVPLALPYKPSIAVLPFENMSGDPSQEYFADGMVEDIITGLSRSKSLFVIAPHSTFTRMPHRAR
jgi:hypothetical protein